MKEPETTHEVLFFGGPLDRQTRRITNVALLSGQVQVAVPPRNLPHSLSLLCPCEMCLREPWGIATYRLRFYKGGLVQGELE